MPPREKHRRLAVQRTSGVREDQLQLREVDRHVVREHRIRVEVARAGKHRRARVNHHRHSPRLTLAIDLGELRQIEPVRVRREELVRRMNLDHPDAEVEDAADLGGAIALVEWIHRSDGKQPVAMPFREVRDPVIHFAREAHDVGRHVVDAARALDAVLVEIAQDVLGRRQNVFRAGMRGVVDQRECFRTHHLPRLNVNVDVEDATQVSITRRMQVAVEGQASWNSRDARSCGCTSSRSIVLKPRFLKYSSAVVVSR